MKVVAAGRPMFGTDGPPSPLGTASTNARRRWTGRVLVVGAMLGVLATPGLSAVAGPDDPPPPVETVVAEPSTTETTAPVTTPPTTDTSASTSIAPTTTAPTTTSDLVTAPTTIQASAPTTADEPPADSLEADPGSPVGAAAVSVTVEAVCVEMIASVEVTNTGTDDVSVTVGPNTNLVTVVDPTWRAPWPTSDGTPDGTPDPAVRWQAIDPVTFEIVDSGEVFLTPECTPETVPSSPEAPTATPDDGTITLEWTPPASDGGSAITDYVIEQSLNGIDGWVLVDEGDGTATTHTFTGLANGTTYYYRVLAVNGTGASDPSADVKATPRTLPDAPQTVTAVPTNVSGEVRLTWQAPAFDGGAWVTDYVIEQSPDGVSGWVTVDDGISEDTAHTMTGLIDGTGYFFRVTAVNEAGPGPASNVVNQIPRTVPSAPRALVAVPTNQSGQIRLSWLAPATDGGSPVIDYQIQRSPNGAAPWLTITDGIGTGTTYTVTGLANGTRYYFRVLALNAAGPSIASNVVREVPRAVTSAPRSLVAAPTNRSGQIRLSWLAPSSVSGAAVTDYVIQRSPTGASGWVTISDGVSVATTYTLAGLANGTRYYFRVYARNAAGLSPASNLFLAVPRTIPSAPRSLVAAPTNLSGQIRLSWLVPLSNGGAAISDYVIQRSPNGTTGWTNVIDGVRTTTAYTVTGPPTAPATTSEFSPATP